MTLRYDFSLKACLTETASHAEYWSRVVNFPSDGRENVFSAAPDLLLLLLTNYISLTSSLQNEPSDEGSGGWGAGAAGKLTESTLSPKQLTERTSYRIYIWSPNFAIQLRVILRSKLSLATCWKPKRLCATCSRCNGSSSTLLPMAP